MKRNREYWEMKINEYRNSRESLRGWCDKTQTKRSSMRYWIERLDELANDDGKVRFAMLITKNVSGDNDDV